MKNAIRIAQPTPSSCTLLITAPPVLVLPVVISPESASNWAPTPKEAESKEKVNANIKVYLFIILSIVKNGVIFKKFFLLKCEVNIPTDF